MGRPPHCAPAATPCRNHGNRSEEAHRALPRDLQGGLRRETQPADDVLPPAAGHPAHHLVLYFYVLAAGVLVIIAWFALLFTGRYPQGMYDFVARRAALRDAGLRLPVLLTDEYPPFSGSAATPYPVDLNISAAEGEYSRLKVLFRLILAIPVSSSITRCRSSPRWARSSPGSRSWSLGRQPKGLQDMIALGMSYQQRAYAYLSLLTEDWPPFTDETEGRTSRPRRRSARWPPAHRPRAPSTRPPCHPAATPRPSARRPSRPRRAPPESEPPTAVAEPAAPEAPAAEPSFRVEPAESAEPAAPAPEPPAAAPEPEPPSEPEPPAPTSGDPLGGAAPPRHRPPRPSRRRSRARRRPATGRTPSRSPARPLRATGPTPNHPRPRPTTNHPRPEPTTKTTSRRPAPSARARATRSRRPARSSTTRKLVHQPARDATPA